MTDSPPHLELWRTELKRLRNEMRLTNQELADLVSDRSRYPVTAQTVSNWQTGHGGNLPTFEHQRAIAALVFRDDPGAIFGRADDSYEGDPRGDDPGSY